MIKPQLIAMMEEFVEEVEGLMEMLDGDAHPKIAEKLWNLEILVAGMNKALELEV